MLILGRKDFKQNLYISFALFVIAILGFHGMLNQVQYHQAFIEGKPQGETAAGFQGTRLLELNVSYVSH